jgi:hypothetical protein
VRKEGRKEISEEGRKKGGIRSWVDKGVFGGETKN